MFMFIDMLYHSVLFIVHQQCERSLLWDQWGLTLARMLLLNNKLSFSPSRTWSLFLPSLTQQRHSPSLPLKEPLVASAAESFPCCFSNTGPVGISADGPDIRRAMNTGTLTWRSGQPPEERGPGCFRNSGGNWSGLLHPGGVPWETLFFQGVRHYMITHDDRFCCCCVLCGAGPSRGSQRCLPKHPHDTQGQVPGWASTRKGLTNTKMGLRPKRRMNFVFWGCSGCPGVKLLNWAHKTREPDTSGWLVTMSRW